jgi:hypothetical protein
MDRENTIFAVFDKNFYICASPTSEKMRYKTLGTLVLSFFLFTAQAQIVNIESQRVAMADSSQFAGSISLGASLIKNVNSLTTVNFAEHLEYKSKDKKHFIMATGSLNLVKTEISDFQNDAFQHLRYNYHINNNYIWELYGQVQYNKTASLAIRSITGTGMRFKVFRNKKTNNRFFVGISYLFENEQLKKSLIVLDNHRMSAYTSIGLMLPNKSQITNTTYYQPLLSDLASARISSITTLSFNFTDHLSFQTVFSIASDNDDRLPPEVPPTTYSWTNGFKWTFK